MLLNNLSLEKQEEIKNLEFNPEKPKKDLTGQTFERLTVLGRGPEYISPSGKKGSQWWCICDCPEHNIILVRINNLTSGNTKSCGCLNKEKSTQRVVAAGKKTAIDITGEHFGELVALEATDQRNNGSVVWKCQCSCGKEYYASCKDLRAGRINNCGCLQYQSKGCRIIKKLLDDNNIPYITEKTYPDFKFTDTNGTPRFDFWINNEFLLEYDGEQHFLLKDDGYFKDTLEKRQQHDKIKNEWCLKNHIPLKRINYKTITGITIEDIMGDKYLIKP